MFEKTELFIYFLLSSTLPDYPSYDQNDVDYQTKILESFPKYDPAAYSYQYHDYDAYYDDELPVDDAS